VPSTGEYCPYVHIFFRLGDGSHIAFFDLGDGTASAPSPNTPAWVNHLALRVASLDDLHAARQRLLGAGVEVIGPTDHHIIQSIYFFDPNGIRLELTVPTVPDAEMQRLATLAHADLAAWTKR
jgi:catechol 2,3-dioxygenase-like lactoylglutathione lyase family enzyme